MPFASTNFAASGVNMHRSNTIAVQLSKLSSGLQPFPSTNLAASGSQPFISTKLAASGTNTYRTYPIAEQLVEEWDYGLQTPLYDEEEYKWYCDQCADGPHPSWQDHCAICGHKKCNTCRWECHPKPEK